MKLLTLIENQHKLEKAEVEIELIPGIPQIHFLGLPDRVIKESFFRIKSALRASGFKFPVSQQVIVNIKPNSLKKSSKGLELAVALAILIKTEQKDLDLDLKDLIVYGELDLDGGVAEPEDLVKYMTHHPEAKVLTGKRVHDLNAYRISDLFTSEIEIQAADENKKNKVQRPQAGLNAFYTKEEAEILFLSAITKLHVLIAGQAGAGKSTLAKHFKSFVDEPEVHERPFMNEEWRAVLMPHHSVSSAAFLGGGANLYQGEIERAQYGLLILDELLEFQSSILETLRGPMTGEKLRLARAGAMREFDCQFQVIATSNLCPCGKWFPKVNAVNCRFSQKKCRSHLERLSGPVLDRFGLLFFHHHQNFKRTVSGHQILLRLEKYKLLTSKKSLPSVDHSLTQRLYGEISGRRLQFLLKVAEVYALERGAGQIALEDLNQSEKWTLTGFLELERGMS